MATSSSSSVAPFSSATHSSSAATNEEEIWGMLVSECSKNSHVKLYGAEFLIGSNPECNLYLEDENDIFCKLNNPLAPEAGYNITLEITGGEKGVIKVNENIVTCQKEVPVKLGDQFIFGSSKHAYIYQPVSIHPEKLQVYQATREKVKLMQARRKSFKENLAQRIVNADEINVSFEHFPFSLSVTVKDALIASTHTHLDTKSNAPRLLSSLLQNVIICGPPEIYQEALSKALAKQFGAKLLIVDSLSDPSVSLPSGPPTILAHESFRNFYLNRNRKGYFRAGDRVKFVGPRGPMSASLGTVLFAFHGVRSSKIGVCLDQSMLDGNDLGGYCEAGHGFYFSPTELSKVVKSEGVTYDNTIINEIFEVASSESTSGALVVFIKNIEKAMAEVSDLLKGKLENLPHNVVVIVGSQTQLDNEDEKTQLISSMFPNILRIQLPQDEVLQLTDHFETLCFQDQANPINQP